VQLASKWFDGSKGCWLIQQFQPLPREKKNSLSMIKHIDACLKRLLVTRNRPETIPLFGISGETNRAVAT
jgi:hypothetical protein